MKKHELNEYVKLKYIKHDYIFSLNEKVNYCNYCQSIDYASMDEFRFGFTGKYCSRCGYELEICRIKRVCRKCVRKIDGKFCTKCGEQGI